VLHCSNSNAPSNNRFWQPAMFCISLRKRKEWAAVPPALLAVQQPKWTGEVFLGIVSRLADLDLNPEQSLDNHDMAIPVPQHRGDHQEFFRLLLLSSADIQPLEPTMARIERLYHQTGGRQVAIVFLMQDSGNGAISYMSLQYRYVNSRVS